MQTTCFFFASMKKKRVGGGIMQNRKIQKSTREHHF